MQEPGAFYNGIIANITDEAIEFENRFMGEALRRWQISKEDVLARIREADKLRAETEKLRAELLVTPQTAYNLQRLADMDKTSPGRVVDKLVRDGMIELREAVKHG